MEAHQVKDGWVVTITKSERVSTYAEMLAWARYEGLRHDKSAMNEVFLHPLPTKK